MSTWEPAPVEKHWPWWKVIGVSVVGTWAVLTFIALALACLPLALLGLLAYVTRR